MVEPATTRQPSTEAAATAQREIIARLERLPISSWHVKARIVIGTATFFDGFDVLAITYVLPAIVPVWKLHPEQVGLMISSAFAGQLIGTLASGWLAERYGRLRVAALTIALFGVMSLACGFAWNSTSLIVFRFLEGIGLGGEVPIAAAYISEIARARGRGRFFTFYELLFPVGLFFAAILGFWLVPRIGWRPMFYIGALPALLILLLRRTLPESPRWLASHGRLEEANAIVSRIERLVTASGKTLPPPNISAVRLPASQKSRWREIFEGVYLRRTLVVWALWFCCFTVTYGLTTWLPTLYRTVFHLGLQRALGYGLITNAVGLAGSTLCAFVIDRVGRRRWFTVAFLGGGLSLCSLWWVGTSSAAAVVFCASASFFFISSISLTLYLYTSELYPTRIRAFGCSAASAWLRLASALGPSLVGFMLAANGFRAVFTLFGCVALIGGIVAGLGATETGNVVLEELSP